MFSERTKNSSFEMIHIVCAIDDNYTPHCGVMLTSLFENNPDERFVVHILVNTLLENNQQKLLKIANKYGQKIVYYSVKEYTFSKFPIRSGDHVSLATYYRLFIPDLLPTNIEKVLYLDSDIVIRGSIHDLWNIDLGDYPVAAAEDIVSRFSIFYDQLGYSADDFYFNAGVLLINLNVWRKINFSEQAIGYVNTHQNQIIYHDQDVMNAFFHGTWLRLYYRWNFQDPFATSYYRESYFKADLLQLTRYAPIIIHFSSNVKPWHYECRNPFKSEYFRYLDMTEWRGSRPSPTMKQRMKCFALRLLDRLNIRRSWLNKYTINPK